MANIFEDYVKSHPAFTAEDARAAAQASYEQQRIDEYEDLISTDYFQEVIGMIKEAADKGESNTVILPAHTEDIEGYTREHKLVPKELLTFTDEQRKTLSGLSVLSYVVNIVANEGYFDGMNLMDKPISVEQASIYWGRN